MSVKKSVPPSETLLAAFEVLEEFEVLAPPVDPVPPAPLVPVPVPPVVALVVGRGTAA
jgi:hypothetical protein